MRAFVMDAILCRGLTAAAPDPLPTSSGGRITLPRGEPSKFTELKKKRTCIFHYFGNHVTH